MHRETPIRRSLFQSSLPRGGGNSNRYTVRIEFPVSYRKQRAASHSNRYKTGSFFGEPRSSSFQPQASRIHIINRQPKLIETLVSHSKQRAVLQINRQLFYPACPDAGRESATVRRSNGSGPPACPDAGRESAAVRRSNGSSTPPALKSCFPIPNTQHPIPCPAFNRLALRPRDSVSSTDSKPAYELHPNRIHQQSDCSRGACRIFLARGVLFPRGC